jgi:hypothetical protein
MLLAALLLSPAPAFALQDAPGAAPVERASLVAVDLTGADLELADLLALGFDVVFARPGGNGFDLVADAEDLARLAELEIEHQVVHADLTAFYASRLAAGGARGTPGLGAWLSPPFGQGGIGGYYTYAQVGSVLDQIAAAYPDVTTAKFSLGLSREGRNLWALKVSDDPDVDQAEPEVRFDAMHHAREPESMQALLWALLWLVEGYGSDPLATWIVDNREIWFVPVVNPDGYVYNQTTAPGGGGLWRKNRRNNGDGSFGVDLNRNYPFNWGFDDEGSSPFTSSEIYRGTGPASEPEVAAMVAFLAARDFVTALSCHTFANIYIYPLGYVAAPPANDAEYAEISALATEDNHYPYGPGSILLYLTNGTTNDHEHAVHGTLSWTPEIGGESDGFWPPTERIVPLAEENLLAFQRTALAAGGWARVATLAQDEVGDGDGFFEAGESLELRLEVRNSGKAATATGVVATLSSPSPEVSVVSGSFAFGALAPFTSADNDAAPLSLSIDPGAPVGTVVPYTLALSWEGFSELVETTLVVGEPAPFLTDDVELDLGWLAGLPGDTADTGLWVFGNPVGTFSGSDPLNPENDATPGSGVNCFTTGNGSTSSGGDDVDGGETTLVTPAIDLSGVGPATLSYSRWYANFGSPADDVFDVSISSDDGASWVPLESVAGAENSWVRRSFLVQDFVPQSAEVRVRFVARDDPNNSLTEAAIDELEVEVFDARARFNVYGRPTLGDPLALHVSGGAGAVWIVYWSRNSASFTLPFVEGPILLLPPVDRFAAGVVPAGGLARSLVTLPGDPALAGLQIFLQGLVIEGGQLRATNRDDVLFE